MKSIQLTHHEPDLMKAIESLEVVEKPIPKPGKGEVLVKIEAAPANPSDLLFLTGEYGVSKTLPTVPGWEGAGRVVESGGGLLGRWLKGKRVACGGQGDRDGTWAEYCVVPARNCVPLLRDVSDEVGSTLIINPLTGVGLVKTALDAGHQGLVQTGAFSQVGRVVRMEAHKRGVPLINLVRRSNQVDSLKKEGERWAICSEDPDFLDQLRDLCESIEPTALFDAVAGPLTGQILGCLPPKSEAFVYGALSGEALSEVSPLDLIFKEQTIQGFWLTKWIEKEGVFGVIRATRGIQQAMAAQEYRPLIHKKVGIGQWKEALIEYTDAMSLGKMILCPLSDKSQRQYHSLNHCQRSG